MNRLQTIDVALDEMLVNLAAIVLRLSKPDVTRTPEARRWRNPCTNTRSARSARAIRVFMI
jgi:hypothetical protein